MNIKWKKWEWK